MSKKKKIVLSIALVMLVSVVVYLIIYLCQLSELEFYFLNEYKQALIKNPNNEHAQLSYNLRLKWVIMFFINIILIVLSTTYILYYEIKKLLKK